METDPSEAQIDDPTEGGDEESFSEEGGESGSEGGELGGGGESAGESEAPTGP